MLRASTKILATAAVIAAVSVSGPAAGATGGPSGTHGGVAIATTKHPSELRGTVPIGRRGPGRARVVMSMGPGRLPDLRSRDKLRLLADVQVTMDCYRPLPRCAGRPYHFNPVVEGRLQISASGTPGGRSVTVATRKLQCLQHQPARQHHCPLVLDARDVSVDRRLPCPPSHCFVNVVVSAHSRAADGGEVVVIGANKPSGRIVRGKGEISVMRIRPPTPAPDTLSTREPRRRTLPLDARRRVVFSRRVSGLEHGDALSVAASMRSDVRQLGYNALVGAQLILARAPGATRPSAVVRRSASRKGVISQVNGTNCTAVKSPCGTRKVGVLRMRRTPAGDSGHPVTLFVNLVIRTKQKQVARNQRDRLHVAGGELEVRVYRDRRR